MEDMLKAWTLEEMRAMRLPTTAWVTTNGGPARPVILRSVTTHRGVTRGPCEEIRASWVTEQAHYATADVRHVENGTIKFFPVNPDGQGVT